MNGAPERYATTTSHDARTWDRVEGIVERGGHRLADVLDAFPLYVRRMGLTRFLAHYELYRRVADLPGSFVEVGVYRGAGLMTWAKLLEIFHAGDRSRKVIGFDNFAGFASLAPEDGPVDEASGKVPGGWSPAPFYDELREHVDVFHDDSFLPRAKRVELVVGDVCETAERYVAAHPGLRISLLHLDVDLYAPTLAALRAFYPLVVKGGIVVLDEYAQPHWAGESRAVEEYFGDALPRIEKFGFATLPGGFFVKP